MNEKFIEEILLMEDFLDEIFVKISEYISPTFHSSKLPTFTKRDSDQSSDDGDTSCLTRATKLKKTIESWRQAINKHRDRIDSSSFPLSATASEMIGIIEDCMSNDGAIEKFPLIAPPSLQLLEDLLVSPSPAIGNRITRSRIETSLQLFRSMFQKTRETCMLQWMTNEATSETQQVMMQCLLKMFCQDLFNIAVTLKHFYDKKISIEAKRFNIYTEHQKEIALKHQKTSYAEMGKSILSQTLIFKDMMKCLSDELDNVPLVIPGAPGAGRLKAKNKLEKLKLKNEKILCEAEIYYEAARKVVLPQTMSIYFFKSISGWLYEYQVILIENLSAILISINNDAEKKEATSITNTNTNNNNNRRSSSSSVNILYNYAKKLDPSKLMLAPQTSSTASANDQKWTKPGNNTINDILIGFSQLHLNTNKQNLTALKKNIDQMFIDYEALKNEVRFKGDWRPPLTPQSLQGNNYQSSNHQPQSVNNYDNYQEQKYQTSQQTSFQSSLGQPSSLQYQSSSFQPQTIQSSSLALGGYGGMELKLAPPPPLMVKEELKMKKEKKESEEKLGKMYNTLFNVMKQDYIKLDGQTSKLIDIVDYLKQYNSLVKDWEEKIKQERAFISEWKKIRKQNSQYIASQFMAWNHFVTEEVDVFQKVIEIYSVNIFHKLKELSNEASGKSVALIHFREDEVEGEIKLLNGWYNDIREEQDTKVADTLVRVQGSVENWINRMNELYKVYHKYRARGILLRYLDILDSFLDTLENQISSGALSSSSTSSEDGNNELGVLLFTLDTMYETCGLGGKEDIEEEKELKKSQFYKQGT